MEVALDPAALGVTRLDDAQSRCSQLVARLRARDGQADELRECLQAALGLERELLILAKRDDERTPRDARDRDRHTDAGSEPERPQLDDARAVELVVARPGRCPGLEHRQCRAHLERVRPSHLEGAGRLSELADDRRRSRILEAVEDRGPQPQQEADLLGHGLEHLFGRGVAGHEGRHPAKCGLLGRESLLLRLGAPLLGEVARDRDDLAFAARNDPRLLPMRDSTDGELVLDRRHAADVQCALDGGEDGRRELVRQEVADVASDHLLRWAELGRVLVRPDVEVRAVAGNAEHRVGNRIEEGAVPLLDELRGMERALVGEREAGCGAHGLEQLPA